MSVIILVQNCAEINDIPKIVTSILFYDISHFYGAVLVSSDPLFSAEKVNETFYGPSKRTC